MTAEAPCEALRTVLEGARRAAIDFADVWPHAVAGTLEALADDGDRADWSAVLEDTAGTWAAAYRREAAPAPQLALVLIAEDPDRCEPIGMLADLAGACAYCGGPIGQGKRSTARYCSGRCRRDAHVARAAAA